MKLWQKIYLTTIFLFVVLLNSGMYLVFDMTYRKNLSSEQKKAESEYNMIFAGILRNLKTLAGQKRLNKITVPNILEIYEKYYEDQKIRLMLWVDGTCVYPADENNPLNNSIPDEETQINILSTDGKRTIQIRSILYQNQGKYCLQYEKALSELDKAWTQLERKYLLVSLGFSTGLAVLLYILLARIMRPIQELTQTVDEMGAGNLTARVNVKGSDDIAVLGNHFNNMAEKIENNIFVIQRDAQAKQDFVDNFAHELKSPITSIYGFAEYIQKANVPAQEVEECMKFIMDESSRLLHLSYTLLDMAEIRKKRIAMEHVPVQRLFAGIRKSLGQKAESCCVSLDFYNDTGNIYGNESLLQSLLYNLIHNGICACQKGGKVIVSAEYADEKFHLIVKDNGCGIPQNEIDKITEPFYRIDKGRNRSEGRTGLGLSLCRQIAVLHSAEMLFHSEEGKGTEVIIYFP